MNLIFFALIVHIVAIKGTPPLPPRVMGVEPGPDIFPRSHRLKTQPTSSSSAATTIPLKHKTMFFFLSLKNQVNARSVWISKRCLLEQKAGICKSWETGSGDLRWSILRSQAGEGRLRRFAPSMALWSNLIPASKIVFSHETTLKRCYSEVMTATD